MHFKPNKSPSNRQIMEILMTLATDLAAIKTALGIGANGSTNPPTSDTAALAQIQAGINQILAGSSAVSSGTITSSTAPTITSISPTSGSIAGGTSVTVTGTGFTGATGVNVGTIAGTNLVVSGDTSLTFTTSAQAAGSYDVTVVTPNGTSATSAADMLTLS
jgi:hypothetical protein